MVHEISKSHLYMGGAARFHYLVYLAIKDRSLVDRDVAHSRFIAFQHGELAHMGDRNWSVAGMCVAKYPEEKLVAVGEDGDVFTYVAGIVSDEVVEPRPVAIRGVRSVEGIPVACGMRRQVYRREREGIWTVIHAPAPEEGENSGFEAIDGYSLDEMYAVGWNGEIWRWNGSTWLDCSSLTNLILTGVCCADDGKVYICGQNGTLIAGRADAWRLLEFELIEDDFWDICWFKGSLYIATMQDVFRLHDAQIEPVDFGEDRPKTCYRLTEREGVMWSVGSEDVFSFDGSSWVRLD